MWLKNLIKRFFCSSIKKQIKIDTHVLLRLPSGHKVWLEKEDYQLFRGGNYYIIWNFQRYEANVIHFNHFHTLNFNNILAWGSDGEMATGIADNGVYGIHPYRKRQVINPDHLPYDPKMGF